MPINWPTANPAVTIMGAFQPDQNRIIRSLKKINQTPAGAALFNGLRAGRGNQNNVAIVRGGANTCGSGGGSQLTRTLLAQAILDGVGNVGTEIQNALNGIPAAAANPNQWLANAMNACPHYTQIGPVTIAPSNLGVTTADVQNWIALAQPIPQNHALQNHALRNVLLTVLWHGARVYAG